MSTDSARIQFGGFLGEMSYCKIISERRWNGVWGSVPFFCKEGMQMRKGNGFRIAALLLTVNGEDHGLYMAAADNGQQADEDKVDASDLRIDGMGSMIK